jgi:hypothetical protein
MSTSHEEIAHRVFPPCCPAIEPSDNCDVLDFHYRQLYPVTVGDQRRPVTVEVIIHVRLTRCSGPLTLGDLVYSTTLFPGEKVRLFTSDRRTRFTFDSASKVSYRNEQTQEEHFYMSSWSDFMSDVTVRDSGRSTNTNKGHVDGHGETSSFLGSIFGSPSVDVSGNYNSSSTNEFLRELHQHAQASDHRAEMGSRGASSVSIGEVQTRTHSEGESQDHFESSSREFSNPNKCHAITFFFYRINKSQTVKFTLESVERRLVDPAANTKITNNSFLSRGDVSVFPSGVLATDTKRLEVETAARTAGNAEQQLLGRAAAFNPAAGAFAGATFSTLTDVEPLRPEVRAEALKVVDQDLVKAGLLDKVGGNVTKGKVTEVSFERRFSLPTAGVLVRGCLDECDICEPALEKEIDLDLERKRLENERLKREIELMDQDQQHRCCPQDEEPDE